MSWENNSKREGAKSIDRRLKQGRGFLSRFGSSNQRAIVGLSGLLVLHQNRCTKRTLVCLTANH